MLDHFVVFTKGGIQLFATKDERPLVGNPISSLIANVLLEERTGERQYSEGPYVLRWTFANDYDLVFVAVHQRVLQLLYVDELLDAVKKAVCELINPSGLPSAARSVDYAKFNGDAFAPAFQSLHDNIEAQHLERQTAPKTMRTFEQTDRGKKMAKEGKLKAKKPKKPKQPSGEEGEEDEEDEQDDDDSEADAVPTPPATPPPNSAAVAPAIAERVGDEEDELEEGEIRSKPTAPSLPPRSPLEPGEIREDEEDIAARREEALKRLEQRGVRAKGVAKPMARKPKAMAVPAMAVKAKAEPTKKPKVGRKSDTLSKEELEQLDVAKAMGKAPAAAVISEELRRQFVGEKPLNLDAPVNDEDEGTEDDDDEGAAKKSGFFSSFISSWTNRKLERKDVDPILAKFRDHLIAKNVATEIADKLVESVANGICGTTQSSFKSVNATLKQALKDSLTRILTPKKSVNILLDINTLRQSERPRPYTITFVGVNGVGKSTSLAKVCYWLQHNGLRVMIAACDTFRSGAVEQLRVHCAALNNTFLYEKGYGKDAAEVARDAISYGKDNRYDVVLIDTAGRMEGNEPLMRALAKLVTVNTPDLILFVGEALVGNKAVEQLTKFNQALIDMSDSPTPRTIDGIFLTKFDTIDDKVGAALSMVYTTGQPIVFLGQGQHYHSLRSFSVDHVLPPLLKVL